MTSRSDTDTLMKEEIARTQAILRALKDRLTEVSKPKEKKP